MPINDSKHVIKTIGSMKETAFAAGAGTSKIAGGFKCRLCEEKFPTDEERKQHYVSAHPGEKVLVTFVH